MRTIEKIGTLKQSVGQNKTSMNTGRTLEDPWTKPVEGR